MSHSYTELELAVLARNGANAMAGVQKRRADRLRKELEHAKAALAGDSEGIRLWMLTCAEATERHRQNAARSEAAAEEAEAASADVLRIVSDWCIEANEVGGVDAGDLAWRLEQAGYPFADPH